MFVTTNPLITGLYILPQASGGASDTVSGVAAKGQGASYVHSCLVKTNVRLRQRAALGSLRIPTPNLEGPGFDRDDTFSPSSDSSASMAPVQFLPGPETLEPLEIDTDTETPTSTPGGSTFNRSWKNLSTSLSRRPPCGLADLSNYLDISQPEEGDVMMRRVVTDSLTRESSCDADFYGWESEYDRRPSCGNTKLSRSLRRPRLHRS